MNRQCLSPGKATGQIGFIEMGFSFPVSACLRDCRPEYLRKTGRAENNQVTVKHYSHLTALVNSVDFLFRLASEQRKTARQRVHDGDGVRERVSAAKNNRELFPCRHVQDCAWPQKTSFKPRTKPMGDYRSSKTCQENFNHR